jgi:hypothetical protein
LSTVLDRAIDVRTRIEHASALRIRIVQPGEAELYGTISAQGWSEHPEFMPYMKGFAKLSVACATCFIAERDGYPIATAALFMRDGTALLAGARLQHAASLGCDRAMPGAGPGSASQRNAERQGFRIAYTRTKWQLNA